MSVARDFRLAQIDAADVGQFTAAALLDPSRFAGVELDLVYEPDAMGTEVIVRHRTEEGTAKARKTIFALESQTFWRKFQRKADPAKLAPYEYGLQLTSFKEFVQREKSALRDGWDPTLRET